jgi:uncharacterized repeat protein (TIGR03803 family)
VLHSFGALPDGEQPYEGLIFDLMGNLYGTTHYGGTPTCFNGYHYGCGTVFKVSATGSETVLHEFGAYIGDGKFPSSVLVRDAEGNVYGATSTGYRGNIQGTVFKISSAGVESIFYAFKTTANKKDGDGPTSLIVDKEGNFYGTTAQGGAYGHGTVFKLTPAGKEAVLYSFTGGRDGANPQGSLVLDAQGNLYGTTSEGGIASGGIGGVCTLDPLQPGCGVIFELSPTGTEKVLYRFKGKADGALSSSGLVLDAQGNLYGTTYEGGSSNCQYGCGVVFRLTP